jgi:N-acetylglucosamine malate deacetylase 1
MVDILAIGAHPDDIELACSGTLMKHIDMGYSVGIVDLTLGELGTRGNAQLRLQEAENGREIIGAQFRENLRMSDGFFEINEINIKKVATAIRKYRPHIVLANAIADRHPDHGKAAELISKSCFYSGLRKIILTDGDQNLDAWRPQAVYNYIQDRNLRPDFIVDISDYMDRKLESILAFKSQFYISGDQEPQTPISSRNFFDFIKAKAKTYARDIDAEYAEAFNVERTPGVRNLFDLD